MYNYFGFFSYKRSRSMDPWHARTKNQLRTYISSEFAQARYDLFLDTDDITSGSNWSDKLAVALAHSPILIAFCSAAYFGSP